MIASEVSDVFFSAGLAASITGLIAKKPSLNAVDEVNKPVYREVS
jgi:hypothetical protein